MATLADVPGMIKDHVRETATSSIVLSVLLIISGVLAIAIPPVAGLAVTMLFGWLLLATAAVHVGFAWRGRGMAAILGEIAVAVLYAALGFYMLTHPAVGLASLTLIVAGYFAAKGLLEEVLAFRLRRMPGSGWMVFDGLLTIVIAAMIAAAWPASSAWTIGVLVGIALISSGCTRLMASVAVRRLIA